MNAPTRLRADEKVFTPVGVARLINVHVKSVANWIRQGRLQAYRTPGGHHRITRTAVLRFLNEQKMPLPEALCEARRRILIVDEDPNVSEIVEAALSGNDDRYEVTTIPNGLEALIEIGRHLPDLIVMDCFMSQLNGFEVCKLIKGNPERGHLRILSLSGDHNPDVREKIMACGADAVLLKPLDLVEVRRQIEALIED
ncbi:MAG: response regulator [Acidobacteriota bacterium]|jgi:excisionase family DNA binding protein|nr:response regulator [Acidobacteriota bacterium]